MANKGSYVQVFSSCYGTLVDAPDVAGTVWDFGSQVHGRGPRNAILNVSKNAPQVAPDFERQTPWCARKCRLRVSQRN